ncbi:hypothetical protein FOXG_20039 [Fusarium oxysporum f. sp. lycopersici 4287]|uniref:Uncharacterized protein n=1 Tax=Fusarium oxysporum f. sp. lycopersici (strain 4287 / CBS 123668 / FGSC 9935 / NRRL 34936) TaxID=426428 RepID=A0A0J9WP75_FUSO4|nr:hypothetical protein FOXG_20039 [Fusarium oxysporum f. sp. lycopersici 4287]KNB08542.1 hypothetical protein FOXG_20039 [Fusarium oxysporum f. sp. lycopersici 4287]
MSHGATKPAITICLSGGRNRYQNLLSSEHCMTGDMPGECCVKSRLSFLFLSMPSVSLRVAFSTFCLTIALSVSFEAEFVSPTERVGPVFFPRSHDYHFHDSVSISNLFSQFLKRTSCSSEALVTWIDEAPLTSCSSQQLREHVCSVQGKRSKEFRVFSSYCRIINLEIPEILYIAIAIHPSVLIFLCNSSVSKSTAHCAGKDSS